MCLFIIELSGPISSNNLEFPEHYIIIIQLEISQSLCYLTIWITSIYSYVLHNHQAVSVKFRIFCDMGFPPKFCQLLFFHY